MSITFLLQLLAVIEACRARDRDPKDLEAKSGTASLCFKDFAQEGIIFDDARVSSTLLMTPWGVSSIVFNWKL